MMLHVSCGLQRPAVHKRAWLPLRPFTDVFVSRFPDGSVLCRRVLRSLIGGQYFIRRVATGGATVTRKLVALVSWIGFLASAVSEYICEVDFPFTPMLWLVIGICVAVIATAHPAISGRTHGGKSDTGIRWIVGAPSLPDSASTRSGNTVPRVDDDDRSPCDYNLRAPNRYRAHSGTTAGIVMVSDTIPAVVFLSTASTRGPPWRDNHIDATPGRPAQHVCPAAHPSEIHLPSHQIERPHNGKESFI
jgi:hypothetical protein